MRLDKYLCDIGKGTRKDVKKLIKSGAVSVDGSTVCDPSENFDENACVVSINGKEVKYEKYIYLMMNKPKGYISATDDKYQKTVLCLLDEKYRFFDLFPAGRLDIDTEGFLLLTNDGTFAHEILSPKKHVAKTYYAHVSGEMDESHIKAFSEGITFDGYKAKSAKLKIIKSGLKGDGGIYSEIELTIYEGKFHQVKKMFEAVGSKVLYLKRIAMGNLFLDGSLEKGQVKKLTKEDIEKIKEK